MEEQISYIDENGVTQNISTYKIVSSSDFTWGDDEDALYDGAYWYVVNSKMDPVNVGYVVSNKVNLILMDDCSLTVTGAFGKAGISVSDNKDSNFFTVYGQTEGTGTLNATSAANTASYIVAAGIGGNSGKDGFNITINGGIVNATSGNGAGIGGGSQGNGSNIAINGGIVNAISQGGAAIGGGYRGQGDNITINNGTVTVSTMSGSVIGNGSMSTNSATKIKVSGDLLVKAGKAASQISSIDHDSSKDIADDLKGMKYAVIQPASGPISYIDVDGSTKTITSYTVVNNSDFTWGDDENDGWYVVNENITVQQGYVVSDNVKLILMDDCTLTVTGEQAKAGIGVSGEGKSFTVYGQTKGTGALNVTGGDNGAGIGGDSQGNGSNIAINGGIVTANGGADAAGIGGGSGGDGSNITINSGIVNALGKNTVGIGGGVLGISSNIKVNKDLSVIAGPSENQAFEIDHDSSSDIAEKLENNSYIHIQTPVSYIDADGSIKSIASYTIVSNSDFTWGDDGNDGWYVVNKDITINQGYRVTGNVKLILMDGCTLSVTGGYNQAGINVSGTKDFFMIYGQTEGTGALTATGGQNSAGIGGGFGGNGSNITISGGTVTATGGQNSAGIGGGSERGSGSYITINGGTVTATGGQNSAGIGGGAGGNGSNITISGGTVTATGGGSGDGIGGGKGGSGSDIFVNREIGINADGQLLHHDSEEDISVALAGKQTVKAGIGRAVVNSSDWGDKKPGDTVTVDGNKYIIGKNAFADIKDARAIDVLGTLGTIVIAGGIYNSTLQVNPQSLVILDGEYQKVLGGGIFGEAAELEGGIALDIRGGSFKDAVACGDGISAGVDVTREGDLAVTVSGGAFDSVVAGGMFYCPADSSTVGSARLDGNVSFTIEGGTFKNRIFGGSIARVDDLGNNTAITGSVSLTIDSGDTAVSVNEHIVAGSMGGGVIGGDINVTFTGSGNNLKFNEDSVVFGGSNGDYTQKTPDGDVSIQSAVTGERKLTFDDFKGNFGAEIRMFSSAEFTGESQVAFTDSNLNLWAVEDWSFQFGSSAEGLAANDFEGDDLSFDLTGYDNSEWTVLSGSADAFSTFDKIASVSFTDGSTAEFDGAGKCWTDGTYRLFLDDNNGKTSMILAKATI